jgi:hypothetical protein
VVLGKVVDDGDDRSAPVEKFSFFLIFLHLTPHCRSRVSKVATNNPFILLAVKINDGFDPTAHSIQWW